MEPLLSVRIQSQTNMEAPVFPLESWELPCDLEGNDGSLDFSFLDSGCDRFIHPFDGLPEHSQNEALQLEKLGNKLGPPVVPLFPPFLVGRVPY